MAALKADDPSVTQQRVEFVGPQVGKELYENGALALLLVSLGIVGYLALRFEWRFAVAAIIANLHDVIIILGFFAFFQWEFSLPVLAAILAVLGYSVNESVVIADRIRENFRKMRKARSTHVIDNAITSTISRTIITHGCTLMMVLSICFFGGETLHYFALALTIGICFGIYSSVLVMAPLVMWMGVSREDLVKPEQEGPERATRSCRELAPSPMLTDALLLAPRARPDAGAARRRVRPLALRAPVRDHLRGDGPRRHAVPARRLAAVHRRHGRRASAGLNVHVLVALLIVAAILGDSRELRDRALHRPEGLRPAATRAGSSRSTCAARRRSTTSTAAVTIIIGRFVPIIRTFAPFLAGVAGMRYRRFLAYNVSAASSGSPRSSTRATCSATSRGSRSNLTWIVIGIVVVSLIPAVVDVPAGARTAKRARAGASGRRLRPASRAPRRGRCRSPASAP